MKIQKQNASDVQALALDLSQRDEIDQKVEYYKSLIQVYSDLDNVIDKKIESESDEYNKCKLTIEKLELGNKIFSMKAFFEMWLTCKRDYDAKFSLLTKECNEKFDEVYAKFKELFSNHLILKTYIEGYDNNPDKSQRIKNEFYALIKYEVMKATQSKESFLTVEK